MVLKPNEPSLHTLPAKLWYSNQMNHLCIHVHCGKPDAGNHMQVIYYALLVKISADSILSTILSTNVWCSNLMHPQENSSSWTCLLRSLTYMLVFIMCLYAVRLLLKMNTSQNVTIITLTIMFRRQQTHTCIVKCWKCHIKRQAKIIPGEKCTATQETISRNH